MGLLDARVDRAFRNENGSRVVVFAGDRRGRGYVVASPAEEAKIRSFLKMYHYLGILGPSTRFVLGLRVVDLFRPHPVHRETGRAPTPNHLHLSRNVRSPCGSSQFAFVAIL
jgi:hypothetical protein